MHHTPAKDFDRITDYVFGNLSPEEITETERWIADDEDRQALARYLHRSREALQGAGQARVDMTRLLRRVTHRIEEPLEIPPTTAGAKAARIVPVTSRAKTTRQRIGIWGEQPLQQILSIVFDRLASSAVAALFGRKVTTLTAAEFERLRRLVEHANAEDE